MQEKLQRVRFPPNPIHLGGLISVAIFGGFQNNLKIGGSARNVVGTDGLV